MPFTPANKVSTGFTSASDVIMQNQQLPKVQGIDAVKGLATGGLKGVVDSYQSLGSLITDHLPKQKDAVTGKDVPMGFSAESLAPKNDAEEVGKFVGQYAPIGIGGGKSVAGVAKKGVEKAAEVVGKGIKPELTATQAAGQIAQGKTKDIAPVLSTIKNIGTDGVKTFSDLSGKLGEHIKGKLAEVDTELLKDKTVKPIQDLAVKQKTLGGQEVSTDYVSRALTGLKDLYKNVGDDLGAANMDELLQKASKEGLTNKDVNDIARLYGNEFSTKAFTKAGDPKPGINAELFESTRKGLKEVARSGMTGDTAKKLDSEVSDAISTKQLVDQNVEAVNKLKQKIEERGWLAKAGYNSMKAINTLTGGALRGITDAVLNRGTGLKTLNPIDLEKKLQENLQVIKRAQSTRSETELLNMVDSKKKVLNEGKINIGTAIGAGATATAAVPVIQKIKEIQDDPEKHYTRVAETTPQINADKVVTSLAYNETRGEKTPYTFSKPSGSSTQGDALGKYQVTEGELKTYGKRYLGKIPTKKEFLSSVEMQEKYIKNKVNYLIKDGYTLPQIFAAHRGGVGNPDEKVKKYADYVKSGIEQYNH